MPSSVSIDGGIVGDVRCAFERDEAVASVAVAVRRPQQIGCTRDVVERDLEEQLACIVDPGADGGAELIVVAVRAA